MLQTTRYGIIGTGMLGQAMATGALKAGLPPENLWLANRTGRPVMLDGVMLDGVMPDGAPLDGAPPEATHPGAVAPGAAGRRRADRQGVTFTADLAALAARCDVVVLCVPPAAIAALDLHMPDRLILSVVAGLTRARMSALTGSARVIRAMSSPAAARGLAYSPWIGAEVLSAGDRARANAFFTAIGTTDELPDEAMIDDFTALTGPVPGFVAAFADSLVRHATTRGIPPEIALRATRQLLRASADILQDDPSPADHVAEMIAYAGTTAAGLESLAKSPFDAALSEALRAATEKARSL